MFLNQWDGCQLHEWYAVGSANNDPYTIPGRARPGQAAAQRRNFYGPAVVLPMRASLHMSACLQHLAFPRCWEASDCFVNCMHEKLQKKSKSNKKTPFIQNKNNNCSPTVQYHL
jgi:hypothetical protein